MTIDTGFASNSLAVAAALMRSVADAPAPATQAPASPGPGASVAETFVPSLGLVQAGLAALAPPQPVLFAELVTGTDMLPIDYDVGLMCEDVGRDQSVGPGDLNGWERVTEFPEDVPPPFDFDPETGIITDPHGTRAAVYKRGEPPEYVMVFAGTNDGWDLVTNGQLVAGQIPGATVFVMDLAEWMVGMYPGQVIFGGHSLGGSHAANAALATGAPAITYNSAGTTEATIEYAAHRRSKSDPEGDWNSESVLQEASDGHVRNHVVEGDWLTTVQESEEIYSGGLTVAVGHQISHDRQQGISWPIGNHHMDVAVGATGAGGLIVSASGNEVSIVHPQPRNELVVVTFDDSAAGRDAQRMYQITGELPPDMAGISRMTVIPLEVSAGNADVGPSVTVTYDGRGNRTGEVVQAPGVVITRSVDAEGNEDVDARQYEFTVTPADAYEAAKLNVLFGHDPQDGPFQPGQTSTVTLTHAEMQELEPGLPVPESGLGDHDSTTRVAIQLAGTPGSSLADQLWSARSNGGSVDDPVEAEIEP